METSHPAGWLPDPLGRYQYRYWNGAEWTDRVSTNGSNDVDPHGLAPTPVPTPAVAPAPAPGWAPPGATRPRPSWSTEIRLLVFAGAVALIVGALLPWVKAEAGIFSATKNGIDGDGALTLALGIAIALVFLLVRTPKTAAWLVVAFAAAATAIAGYDAIDVSKKAHDLAEQSPFVHVSASVGVGLWLSLGGAVVALIGGVLALGRGPTGP
jgi:hypothetical protein